MDDAPSTADLCSTDGFHADVPGANPGASDPDTLILTLAARQHGVIARWQLKRAGLPLHRVDYRLKKGWLKSVHHGVYRVGPIAAPRYREMAALLACGADTVLSHYSAGALWDLLPSPGATSPISVSTTRNVSGPAAGVRVYRVACLAADEIAHLFDLPLTTPARTLFDLAGTLGLRELEQAMARADRKNLLDREQLEVLLARYPRRRGRARLRALLRVSTSPALTRSEAEERFLELVRKAAFREPKTNVHIRGFEVDALWERERLIIEIDGFAFHSSSAAFESDRHRDGVLAAAGYRIMRITWRQLTHEPVALVARLAQALVSRGSP